MSRIIIITFNLHRNNLVKKLINVGISYHNNNQSHQLSRISNNALCDKSTYSLDLLLHCLIHFLEIHIDMYANPLFPSLRFVPLERKNIYS